MMMIKVRHTDCQLYAFAKKSTIRRHERNLLQEIEMGSLNQKLNFCIQDGRCHPHQLLDNRKFHAEATLDTTDLDKLNNFVHSYL